MQPLTAPEASTANASRRPPHCRACKATGAHRVHHAIPGKARTQTPPSAAVPSRDHASLTRRGERAGVADIAGNVAYGFQRLSCARMAAPTVARVGKR